MAFAPKKPLRAAVLGATGSVGQRFVGLLEGHPWFELVRVGASPRSMGRPYGEAARWMQSGACPPAAAALNVESCEPARGVDLVFSALDSDVAGPIERAWAAEGALVVSNASSHRMHPEVPLCVPEVNADHLALADGQSFGSGAIVCGPNCSTAGLVLALAPLQRTFGVRQASVVTLQAVSGAGVPGVPSMQAIDNVVPWIPGEEDKLESEPHKILGRLSGMGVQPLGFPVSATATRVPVIDGHTEVVSLSLVGDPTPEAIAAALTGFRAPAEVAALPSAPARPVIVLDEPDGPQPRLHRDLEGGMATVVGRVRRCPVLGAKLVLLTHNTLRGAAGGALLIAEALVARRA